MKKIPNSKLNERPSMISPNSHFSTPQKSTRLSLRMNNTSIAKRNNSKDMEDLKEKHDKIINMEAEIQAIQKNLANFYFNLSQKIKFDERYDFQIREIFFSDKLISQIQVCDPNTLISFIMTIVLESLDLATILDKLEKSQIEKKNEKPNDYIMIVQNLEREVTKLTANEKQSAFTIKSLKARIDLLAEQNKKYMVKTEETVAIFKDDYEKLLQIIQELNCDIESLKHMINLKDATIQELQEKNYSSFVLEHKIKEMDKTYIIDQNKIKNLYEKKIDEIKDLKKFNPNLYKSIQNQIDSIEKMKVDLKTQENTFKKSIDEQKNINNDLVKEKNDLLSMIQNLKREIFEMKEKLCEKNKEHYLESRKCRILN